MTPLAHGIGFGVSLLNAASGASLPVGYAIWELSPSGAVSLTITLLTSDGLPIYVRWGDGAGEWVDHNTATVHNYAGAGTYELKIATPDRLTSFVNADSSIAFAGTVDTTSFTTLTELKIRKAGITAIDVSASVLLETLELNDNALTALDISANTALTIVRADSNALTAGQIDDIITDLDTAGESSGTLNYDTQSGGTEAWASRSAGAQTAQRALDTKTWTITPVSPPMVNTLLLFHFDGANDYKDEVTGADVVPTSCNTDIAGKFGECIQGTAVLSLITWVAAHLASCEIDYRAGFCIECFRMTGVAAEQYAHRVFYVNSTGGKYMQFSVKSYDGGFGSHCFQVSGGWTDGVNSVNWLDQTAYVTPVAAWRHFFFQYDGTNLLCGFNGKIVSKIAKTYFPDLSAPGSLASGLGDCQVVGENSKLDELRVTDKPIYSGEINNPYVVPTAPFTV